MSELKDKIEKLMAGRDSIELTMGGEHDDIINALSKSRARLDLSNEANLVVDALYTTDPMTLKIRKADKPPSPGDRWASLKAEMLAKIEVIDKDTPWSATEPGWWLEMSEFRRLLNK